jgi:hypothetical protein
MDDIVDMDIMLTRNASTLLQNAFLDQRCMISSNGDIDNNGG